MAKGYASPGGRVTGTERMRAALALLVLKAAQSHASDEGEHVSTSELQLIVHLANGSGGLPTKMTWWEKILRIVGRGLKWVT